MILRIMPSIGSSDHITDRSVIADTKKKIGLQYPTCFINSKYCFIHVLKIASPYHTKYGLASNL